MTIQRLSIVLMFAALIAADAQVPFQRISGADSNPGTWVTYSGNYQAQRFTQLDQINKQNVAQLKPSWVYQMRNPGIVETSPIVADGIMYITEPPSTATALDLHTGRPLWTYTPNIPPDVIIIGSPPVNRGMAILDNMVFFGTVNCHLIALDAKTGVVRWDVQVDDNKKGYYVTGAPLAIDGKIVVGVSGAETGIRGFLDAYDAKTGKRVWRTWTVPGPGDPGVETWGGTSFQHGGGSTWVTGSYDPDLRLVYWGTGNPAPDWNDDTRPGDNLYTCSLVALDAETGKLKWYFQFTPHDTHDWDATEIPVLLDATVRGKPRKIVAMANRNAYFYLLDRTNGEFIQGTPYAKQTWSKGLDDSGRPQVLPNTEPTEQGNLVWPSLFGATNWFSPSYDAGRKTFFVATRETGSYYYKGEAEYTPGGFFAGGGERVLDADEGYGAIRALDVGTGKKKWEFPLVSAPWAGVMSTAGGLVFGGTEEGNVFALDSATGKPVWDFQTGGEVSANPISFNIDGKQHVAIAAGHAIFVFGL